MPKYAVYGRVVASKYLGDYEADSEAEAIRMAEDSGEMDGSLLCHYCASEIEEAAIDKCEAELVDWEEPRKPGRGYRPKKTSDNPPELPQGGSAVR